MKNLFIFTVPVSIVLSPQNVIYQYKASQFAKLYALEGTWEMREKRGTYEVWKIINEIYLEGSGFKVAGNDTIWNEQIALKYADGTITYVPKVLGQNDENGISFKLTGIRDNVFVFENKKHDFPKRIVYKIMNDKMIATVSGKTKGGNRKIVYSFTKIK